MLKQPINQYDRDLSGSVVKNPPANSGDVGSIPWLERSSGERNGTLVSSPRKFLGQRRLEDNCCRSHKDSNTSEQVNTPANQMMRWSQNESDRV